MHKEELLKQLYDALGNGADVEKVKITYKNGEVVKIAFDEEDEDDEDDDDDGVIIEDDDEEEDEDDEDEEEEEGDEDAEDDGPDTLRMI